MRGRESRGNQLTGSALMTREMERMPEDHPSQDAAPARLLLVFEEHPFVRSLSQFLRLEGYRADTTIESQAVECLAATRYHLVLADVDCALRLLRRIHLPDVALLVIAGYDRIQSAREAVQLGAFACLIKPIVDDELRLMIQRALPQQTRPLKPPHRPREPGFSFDLECGDWRRRRQQSSCLRKPPGSL